MSLHRTALCLLVLGPLACGRSAKKPADTDAAHTFVDSADANPTILSDSTTVSARKSACPPTGQWAQCSVEKRLKQSGFVVIHDSAAAPARSGFNVKPLVYKLGHARLEVFLYRNAASANRDVASLDTTRAAPRGGSNNWETTPIFVRSGNLLAVFLTDDPRQAERLSLALTAGAPQPAGITTLKASISTPSSPR